MRISELTNGLITDEIVDRVLFNGIEDSGERAECIIVLGSTKASKYRLPVAAEAYRRSRASKLLLCGGTVRAFPEGEMSEAEHMRLHAINMGVKREDILLENVSQNTVENMLGSLTELQRAFGINSVKQVLLVTTSFHMRRSLCLARYLFPAHIKVMPCPADDTNTRRDNWMKSDAGRKRATDEVNNIISCVENGLFPDFEI